MDPASNAASATAAAGLTSRPTRGLSDRKHCWEPAHVTVVVQPVSIERASLIHPKEGMPPGLTPAYGWLKHW